MLGKVTFDERVNVLERYCKGDLYITFTNLNGSLSKKQRSLKVKFRAVIVYIRKIEIQ